MKTRVSWLLKSKVSVVKAKRLRISKEWSMILNSLSISKSNSLIISPKKTSPKHLNSTWKFSMKRIGQHIKIFQLCFLQLLFKSKNNSQVFIWHSRKIISSLGWQLLEVLISKWIFPMRRTIWWVFHLFSCRFYYNLRKLTRKFCFHSFSQELG